MSVNAENWALRFKLHAHAGVLLPMDDINTLRRAEKTLRRWHEQECGDGDRYCSWAIERDPETDIPYRHVYPHNGDSYQIRIPDRETGAIKRVAAICKRNGLYFYVQTDPRGAALRIGKEPMDGSNYDRGCTMYIPVR